MHDLRFPAALATALVIAALLPLTMQGISPIRTANAATTNIRLFGYATGWNATTNPNPTILVTQANPVTLSLSSGDSPQQHRFVLIVDNTTIANDQGCPDYQGDDLCSNYFNKTTTIPYSFTPRLLPGNYTYYCAIHYTVMIGRLKVQAVHDLAVASLTLSRNFAYNGITAAPIKVNATVANQGSLPETLTVSLSANSTSIDAKSIVIPGIEPIVNGTQLPSQNF